MDHFSIWSVLRRWSDVIMMPLRMSRPSTAETARKKSCGGAWLSFDAAVDAQGLSARSSV